MVAFNTKPLERRKIISEHSLRHGIINNDINSHRLLGFLSSLMCPTPPDTRLYFLCRHLIRGSVILIQLLELVIQCSLGYPTAV